MTPTSRTRGWPRSLRLACVVALIAGLIGSGVLSAAEVGANDFPISNMGAVDAGPTNSFGNFVADTAYNSATNEYLVVWSGDDISPGGDGDFEIFAQRLNGATGAKVGGAIALSNTGNGNAGRDGNNPAVAYSAATNSFLVVWDADEVADGHKEIYGKRVGATGTVSDTQAIRLSIMGQNTSDYDALNPAVACTTATSTCLVAWSGNEAVDNSDPLNNPNDPIYEIYGQLVNTSGAALAPTGPDDFRISDMGTSDTNGLFDAVAPAVAYNASANQYLVVWSGDDDSGTLVEDEFEIYGQRISAAGAETGANDFRISDMGSVGSPGYDANDPAVAYNSLTHEYLVTWSGDDTTPGAGEDEIFGQRLSSAGAEVGTNDFRISDMGTDGNNVLNAIQPDVTYNSSFNEYLAVWQGDDTTNDEFEIYGQRISAAGAETGDNDFRISDVGTDGDANFDANLPALAYSPASQEYLAVWTGDDNAGGLVNDQYEVFGQRLEFNASASADLALSKTASPNPIVLGSGNLTYTLTVTNTGPTASSSVMLTDTLPAGVTVASVGAAAGITCTQPAGLVRCDLGTMAISATTTITIAVTPSAAGTLTNTATIASSTTPDPSPANNSATISTTVSPAAAPKADLSVAAGAAGQVALGNTQSYTFTVTNGGPNTATGAQLNASVPAGLELVSATPSAGSCTTNTGTGQVACNLGNLASGASASVRVTVRGTQLGARNIVANVSSATTDPAPGDNTATQSVTVSQVPFQMKLYLPIAIR
jgi:uncharacterized repeat protein (TIGR01451 family)